MRIFATAHFERKYRKIIKKDALVSRQIDLKFDLFQRNPAHPSLRIHKLTGKKAKTWSISIKGNLRIIFQKVKDGVLMVDIGSHDEVY